MKKLNIKNLTIDLVDNAQREDWENAIYHAFETVSSDVEFINLVKVKLPDVPMDKAHFIFRQLKESFAEHGLTNCVFIPIHPQGIQDITIEKLEWVDEKEIL